MKDAAIALPMLFKPFKILLQIGDQHDSSYVLELDSEGDEIPGIADDKMEKVNTVISALTILGGQVNSQAPLKNAVQVELNCSEATARRAIAETLKMKKIIIIPGKKKGEPNSYALPNETQL